MAGATDDPSSDKEASSNEVDQNNSADSDSDDGIVIRRKKISNKAVLEDSSDDETPQNKDSPLKKVAGSSDEEDEESDSGKASPPASPKMKLKNKRLKHIIDSSDEDDDLTFDSPRPKKKPVKQAALPSSDNENEDGNKNLSTIAENESDESDAGQKGTQSEKYTSIQPKKSVTNDIFDAEDSSDNEKGSNNEDSEKEEEEKGGSSGNESKEDSSDDEDIEMTAELRKKLAKGASKKPSKERAAKPQRPTIGDIREIHSESQRIIRESRASVPYHQPAKVGLSVFLERTKQKQEAFKALSNPRASIKVPHLALLGQPSLTLNKPTTRQVASKKSPTPKKSITIAADEEEDKTEEQMEEEREKTEQRKEEVKKQLFGEETEEENKETETAMDTCESESTEESSKELVKPSASTSVVIKTESTADLTESNSNTSACQVIVMDTSINNIQDRDLVVQDTDLTVSILPAKKEKTPKKSSPLKEDFDELNLMIDEDTSDSQSDLKTATNSKNSSTEEENEPQPSTSQAYFSPSASTSHTVIKNPALAPKRVSPELTAVTPKLSGSPHDFVDLEEEEGHPGAQKEKIYPPGVTQLMERLMRHSTKKVKKAKDVTVSTVSKVKDSQEKDHLRLETFTYTVDGDDDKEEDHTPGAKLLRLKEKLAQQMKIKRDEARQLRNQAYAFDNEEGYDEERKKEEEEEAELTDQTDTDEEHYDEEEEEINEEEEEAKEQAREEAKEKKRNPFADDEAEDEEEEGPQEEIQDEDLHLNFADSEDSQECEPREYLKSALRKQKTLELFEGSDDDESQSQPARLSWGERPSSSSLNISATCDTKHSVMRDLSFESQLPAAQRCNSKEPPTPTEEDMVRFQDTGLYHDFHLRFDEDTLQTQMLDADGYLKTDRRNRTSRFSVPAPPDMSALIGAPLINGGQEDEEDDAADFCSGKFTGGATGKGFGGFTQSQKGIDDDELLDLCSGRFTTQNPTQQTQKTYGKNSNQANSHKNGNFPFASQGDDMDDIADLCSGRFTTQPDQSTQGGNGSQGDDMDDIAGLCSGRFTTQQPQSTQGGNGSEEMEKGDGTGPFSQMDKEKETEQPDSPMKVRTKKGRAVIVDDDEEEDDKDKEKKDDDLNESFEAASDNDGDTDNIEEEFDEDEEEVENANFDSDEEAVGEKENTKPKKRKRGEFFDEEAELSGSELGSADEDEGDEDNDELDRMSGDEEEIDQEELRNQVGRMHHKLDIDEGQRAIAHLQEMLLPDGDLTAEGKGRQRKFKWKNVDDDGTQQDLFNSDNEEADEEKEVSEDKWRKERHEREKFLQEQAEAEAQAPEEDSQLKLGKVVFKSKKSANVFSVPTLKKTTHGSFLKRSAADLAKIAEMSKPVANVNGPRMSRNFVFQAVSPDGKSAAPEGEVEAMEDEEANKKPNKRKAHVPVKRALSQQQPKACKRPKLDKANTIPDNSIFKLLK